MKAPGLESDDIWGDAPDPMDEMAGMTDAEIQEKIRDMEAEMRRNRQAMTRLQTDERLYQARLRENQEKLKMST